jgi:L,D-transpeptidase ErfK/SrfK
LFLGFGVVVRMLGKHLKSVAKLVVSRIGLGIAALLAAAPAWATTYVLPAKGDVIGQIQYARAGASDTLLKLARDYDVGYAQIKAANPGVDTGALKKGQRIVIPTRFILPRGARKGIVINAAEQRLYLYTRPEEGPALVSTYPVSFGPEGGARTGHFKIEKRLRKPSWNVPTSLRAANSRLPAIMPPGPKNPLGEFSMKLSGGHYMIHGTNDPYSIGRHVSRGSIRLYPEDMAVLIHLSTQDMPVRIIRDSFKYGYKDGMLYFEIHKPENVKGGLNLAALVNKVTSIVPTTLWTDDWQRIRMTGEHASGIASPVARLHGRGNQPRRWQLQLATFKHHASARKLMLHLEELGVPVSTDCDDGKCRVMAGPFRNTVYMNDLAKRIKWITRIKSITRPYHSQQDELPAVNQTVASAD